MVVECGSKELDFWMDGLGVSNFLKKHTFKVPTQVNSHSNFSVHLL